MRRGLLLGTLLVVVVGGALTASNTISSSLLGDTAQATSPNALKPPECASIVLTAKGSTGVSGQNTLVLGTSGPDSLTGANRNDCLVGGNGDDNLRGNAGSDICIGNGGTDTFHSSCEVRIQ